MKLELERVTIHGQSFVDECKVFTVAGSVGAGSNVQLRRAQQRVCSGLKEVLGQIAVELIKAIIAEVTKEQKRSCSPCAKIYAPANLRTNAHTPDQDANNLSSNSKRVSPCVPQRQLGKLFRALESELRNEPDVIHVFPRPYPNGALVEYEVLRVEGRKDSRCEWQPQAC